SFVGGIVLSMISCLFGLALQSSLRASNCPPLSCNSRTGSASTPASGREGPIARMMTVFGCVPAIKRLFPVPTLTRDEILPNCAGAGVAAGVAVAVAVAVGVVFGVADGVAVGDGVVPTVVSV